MRHISEYIEEADIEKIRTAVDGIGPAGPEPMRKL